MRLVGTISVIHGAGGHARSLFSVACAAGIPIACFVDPSRQNDSYAGIPIRRQHPGDYPVTRISALLGIGDNAIRQRVVNELVAVGIRSFPSAIHPSSIVAPSATLGTGVVVMPGVVVGPDAVVEDFAVLNSGAIVEHDARIGSFAFLAPGSVVAGSASLGRGSFLGMRACVREHTSVGDDVVIGACAFVANDLESNLTVVGAPARKVRTRRHGDPYLIHLSTHAHD